MLNILVAPYEYNENGEKYTKRIVHFLKSEKIDYSVYFSPTINDIGKNAMDLTSEGETDFIIVGDEPIIHIFLNNVADISKIKLGIIPLSKHDDLASYLDLETNPINAIKKILQNKIKTIDYLFMNDKIVINNIIIGASTELFEIYNQYKMKNVFTKNFVLMQYGSNFEGIELSFDIKSKKTIKEVVFELSISNAGYSKNHEISPLANVSDGLFNFNYCSLPERENKKKYLKLFKKGNQIYDEHTKQFWLDNLKISNADNKIKALVDGKIETLSELDISIVKDGLKIFNTIEREVSTPHIKKKKTINDDKNENLGEDDTLSESDAEIMIDTEKELNSAEKPKKKSQKKN